MCVYMYSVCVCVCFFVGVVYGGLFIGTYTYYIYICVLEPLARQLAAWCSNIPSPAKLMIIHATSSLCALPRYENKSIIALL